MGVVRIKNGRSFAERGELLRGSRRKREAMAEAGIGQQRSFVKNLNRQTAQQIRESATATVKAMNEQVKVLGSCWRL